MLRPCCVGLSTWGGTMRSKLLSHRLGVEDRFHLSTASGPDGTPWAGFHCADTAACPGRRIGVVGRLTYPPGR
jgi:hypothetical protein